MGPAAAWATVFGAAIVAVFTLYVGIAMVAALRATDERQAKVRYRIFRDLLWLFRRQGR
ncbi:hypothetical protein [Sphaerisporangium krabiense]|uniref:Uncharacterized protein n=1 Tax=Sphaerisporangium krabiense TaxID=763782 RepID=A0A7W9DSR0_9ACTN|nr:hypothetical protein [Sphaerisporangium krabiense]MBB5629843.1 hypothetical protein [Sphaerisporangium krabiense]